MDNLNIPMEQVGEFCRRWKISELALFGSVLREDFTADSDIDMLVSFAAESDWSLFDHLQMQQELAKLLQRDVDLISKRALDRSGNWLRKQEILHTTQVIYSGEEYAPQG